MKNNAISDQAHCPIITIDGPGGSGKGTMSQWLAVQLGWNFLDSGALYRVLGYYAHQQGVALDNEPKLAELALNLPVEFEADPKSKLSKVLLNQQDVTPLIRTVQCGNQASQVGSFTQVRHMLLERQRAFAYPPGLVADGRDMGTVVFPNAELKIFLTASQEERAKRRCRQLQAAGKDVNLEHILRELIIRDERDAKRVAAPLKAADNAVVVDTTGHSIEEVKAKIMAAYEQVFLCS